MPCCGNRRAGAVAALAPGREQRPRPVAPVLPAPPPVTFEYTGKTSLAVTGPITRATYRFPVPGARVPVHASDAAAVAALPNVRRT
jgi:hypothetical protein